MNHSDISESMKHKILEEILESEDFRQTQKYQDLLRYLVNASIAGENVKESTIAVDFFGKDTAFDPSIDSSVRAYVSNIRKKLEHYYLTEGKNHEIKLSLPKGHYSVEFVRTSETTAERPAFSWRALPPWVYLPVILTFILVVIYLRYDSTRVPTSYQVIPKDNPVWKELLSNDFKTMIVLGDYYFFSMSFDSTRQTYIRDIQINSDSDLEKFLAEHPKYSHVISKTYHTYLEEHYPLCLSYILPSFVMQNRQMELRLSSEVQLEDLQKYNILYIGPYKTLRILETVTRNLNFRYALRTTSSTLSFLSPDSGKTYDYCWVTNPETNARNDYAIVTKVSGHNGNTFLFFLSQHDFGNISTVRYLTSREALREFSTRAPGSFEALFEVKGIIRSDFGMKLLHVNHLHSDFEIELQ